VVGLHRAELVAVDVVGEGGAAVDLDAEQRGLGHPVAGARAEGEVAAEVEGAAVLATGLQLAGGRAAHADVGRPPEVARLAAQGHEAAAGEPAGGDQGRRVAGGQPDLRHDAHREGAVGEGGQRDGAAQPDVAEGAHRVGLDHGGHVVGHQQVDARAAADRVAPVQAEGRHRRDHHLFHPIVAE
ncbi:MAG: hypothetical protein ACK559_38595, partial [bacterium]